MMSSAAAPSFSGELLPAVTVPMPGMKAGFERGQRLPGWQSGRTH